MHTASYGLTYTASGAEAVERFETLTTGYVAFHRDAGDSLKAVFAADPGMPMAHCVKGYFFKLFGSGAMALRAQKALQDAKTAFSQAGGGTDRERLHLRALEAWCAEDITGALDAWERILLDHPLDIFALRLAHFSHFYAGNPRKTRDSIARVLPNWNRGHPHYGYVLGMYGFALEECGDYRKGERFGREAVALNPADGWSVHAVTHVMEMEGRHAEGIAWVKGLEPHWSTVNNFRFHLYWHRALFHLERFELDEVLRLYDEQIVADLEADLYLEVVNAAALLWRLEMYGADVGDRWEALARISLKHIDDHELVFVNLHYLMALLGGGRTREAGDMLSKLRAYAAFDTTQAAIARDVGLALGEALVALRRGDHEAAVAKLLPVRYEVWQIGGSHAQRDLFEEMLVDAVIHAGRHDLGRALLAERTALKPASAWSWRRYGEALAAAGDSRAAAARARADRLVAAA